MALEGCVREAVLFNFGKTDIETAKKVLLILLAGL